MAPLQTKKKEETPSSWWEKVSRAENSFLAYWSAQDDILLYKISGTAQRTLLKQIEENSFSNIIWKFAKFLFILFTIYQVAYGTYQNILYSIGTEDSSTNHFFHYGVVIAYLDFWRQPHLILTLHSITGTLFLLSCMLQVGIVRYTLFGENSKRVQFHRRLGLFSIVNSLIASSCGIWLSFRTLYGTEVVYLLGTATWFYFTAMTLFRGLQKQWLAHSRWALGLQHIGLMFVTTRMYAPLFLYLGFSVGDSYHWGVWCAGVTALLGFGFIERSRQDVLSTRLKNLETKGHPSTEKQDLEYSSFYQLFNRCVFWFLFALIFIGAPVLRYSTFLDSWVSLNVWLGIQAGLLLPFYFLLLSQNVTSKSVITK